MGDTLQIGGLVTAKLTTGVCEKGEKGVCYEVYQIGNRPGYSVIFERGGYDGFSPGDVALMLQPIGKLLPELANYQFQNVGILQRDFEQGRFAPAFC
jgi:hypothetical protein